MFSKERFLAMWRTIPKLEMAVCYSVLVFAGMLVILPIIAYFAHNAKMSAIIFSLKGVSTVAAGAVAISFFVPYFQALMLGLMVGFTKPKESKDIAKD
jgi:hypothetical protein